MNSIANAVGQHPSCTSSGCPGTSSTIAPPSRHRCSTARRCPDAPFGVFHLHSCSSFSLHCCFVFFFPSPPTLSYLYRHQSQAEVHYPEDSIPQSRTWTCTDRGTRTPNRYWQLIRPTPWNLCHGGRTDSRRGNRNEILYAVVFQGSDAIKLPMLNEEVGERTRRP